MVKILKEDNNGRFKNLSFDKSRDNSFYTFQCVVDGLFIFGYNQSGKWEIMNYKNINQIEAIDLLDYVEKEFNKQ